ncbi:serine hydrolase domain-containing protein [Kitasatospora sp. HPMI-4]|uniref:serine hydrolase domain-containing protein n=1 Tax=Kitasatospora sp. HPMI-4 TaxID=3448443 RepID=UPI003F194BC5
MRLGHGLRGVGVRAAIGVLAGATVVGVVAPTALAATPAPAQLSAAPANPALDQELQAALDGAVAGQGNSAALAAVRVDGRTAWKGSAGVADLATGAPVNADGGFRIGSVTKTFVATVVLQLVGEHRVVLDDPIERYLPGVVPNGEHITVRQLLNHTSGIYNYLQDPRLAVTSADDMWKWRKDYQPRGIVDIATSHAPNFEPGTKWSYSNTNYILAGMLIQQVTGHSWAEEVEHRIIRPLGLHHTSMPDTSTAIPGPHAHGYFKTPSGPVDVTVMNPSIAFSAGAGISTTADLARFNAALLGGRLLRPAELVEMKRTVQAAPGFDYGLGLFRVHSTCGELWGHDGGTPGFDTVVFGDPQARHQIVVSYNPYDPAGAASAGKSINNLVNLGACGVPLPSAPATGQQPPGQGQ